MRRREERVGRVQAAVTLAARKYLAGRTPSRISSVISPSPPSKERDAMYGPRAVGEAFTTIYRKELKSERGRGGGEKGGGEEE